MIYVVDSYDEVDVVQLRSLSQHVPKAFMIRECLKLDTFARTVLVLIYSGLNIWFCSGQTITEEQ